MVNCEFVIYPMIVIIHEDEYEYMKFAYMELRINMSEIMIIAVCFQLKQLFEGKVMEEVGGWGVGEFHGGRLFE